MSHRFPVFYRTSVRGTRQLVVGGFAFNCRSYCLNSVKKAWKCSSFSDCKAKVHTVYDEIVLIHNKHHHPKENDSKILWLYITRSQRGGQILHIGGHRYYGRHREDAAKKRWLCAHVYSEAKCQAGVITFNDEVLTTFREHNH
ncbi:hypothetical protein JYU34_004353 [Plutella xylostella]|uniref:FLYWCH-type domain-containing protein n=1 Tax=Plutella xylostella TaxID=51655 RepID=A0ABQ7QXR5_PLUXY|nr:hypothetical protein JYU34_004353 [Plutella xylostella]